jgi:hypothetical protein
VVAHRDGVSCAFMTWRLWFLAVIIFALGTLGVLLTQHDDLPPPPPPPSPPVETPQPPDQPQAEPEPPVVIPSPVVAPPPAQVPTKAPPAKSPPAKKPPERAACVLVGDALADSIWPHLKECVLVRPALLQRSAAERVQVAASRRLVFALPKHIICNPQLVAELRSERAAYRGQVTFVEIPERCAVAAHNAIGRGSMGDAVVPAHVNGRMRSGAEIARRIKTWAWK